MDQTKKFCITAFFFYLFGVGSFCCNLKAQEIPQKLSFKTFKICGRSFNLEIAKSTQERNIGLMGRIKLLPTNGMLFIFDREEILSFWMKKVPFDIDIGYFNKKGVLVSFKTMKGTSPLMQDSAQPSYSSEKPAIYAVEVERGFFNQLKTSKKICKIEPLPLL